MNKHIWGVQMKKLSFKKTTAVAESLEKHAEQNLGSESGWLMDEQMSAVEELDDTGKEKKEQLKKDKIKKEKVKKEKIKKEKIGVLMTSIFYITKNATYHGKIQKNK